MKERIVSIGILVFALVYFAGSVSLKVGTLAQPGAGQFPAAIAFCLLVAAAWQVWRSFRGSGAGDGGRGWTRIAPAGIAAVLIAFPLLLRTCNFLIATFIVLLTLFRLLRFKTTWISLATALFATVFAFIAFAGFLGVVVPGGAMEEFILRIMERG